MDFAYRHGALNVVQELLLLLDTKTTGKYWNVYQYPKNQKIDDVVLSLVVVATNQVQYLQERLLIL